MDNPVRTAAYHAQIQERRREIRAFLEEHLPRGAEFVWEVGCGHGHFLTAYAHAHPEKYCVGIDISSDRIERAQRKQSRAALPNLHFLQAEARLFLAEMPADRLLSAIFILFPDPWPKLRHQKHRILQRDFLLAAAARATLDCPLYFRTDFQPYYLEAAALIRADPSWTISTATWPFEFETVFQQRAPAHYSIVARRHS